MATIHTLPGRILFALICFSFSTLTAQAQDMPSDLNPDSHARLPYVKRSDLSKDDQAIFDMLPARLPNGTVAGPLAWAAYNLGVAHALLDLHNAAVGSDSLSPYERELAIMVACRETNFSLEWNGHMKSALDAGVPESVLNVVKYNQSLFSVPEKDAAIIHFGRQLYGDKKVDSATFAKAKGFLGAKGVMDMVAVMNTYAVSGFFAIAVDEHMGNGKDLK
jgi:4-carboxymuconolactone decarboxylase